MSGLQEPSSRYREAEMASSYRFLAERPEIQAEAIAFHYTKMAAIALELKYILDARRFGATQPVDDLIADLVSRFRQAHEEDLGLPLEWVKNDRDETSR